MNPQYQDDNPYDFIMNPSAPQPKKRLPVPVNGKNAFLVKIGLIVGGVAVLMIIATVAINLFTGGKTSTEELRSLAQTQQELLRVSEEGKNSARAQAVKNFATSTNLSVMTQQLKTLNYLNSKGVTLKEKDLALKTNADTDKLLDQAKQTSTFDSVFLQVMQQELESYSQELQALYSSSSSTAVKTLMKEDFDQAQLLREQQPAAGAASSSSTTTP